MKRVMSERCPISFLRMVLLVLNYFLGYNYLYPAWMIHITKWLDPMARSVPAWLQLSVYAWMIASSVILAFPLWKEGIAALKRLRFKLLWIALGLMGAYYVCAIFLNVLLALLSDTAMSANQQEVITAAQIHPFVTLFSTLIYAPIVEETLFRGVFYRALRPYMGPAFAALISVAMFSFIHVMNAVFSGQLSELIFILPYGLIGLFLVIAYEVSDTIYGSILLHFINNAIAYLFLFIS